MNLSELAYINPQRRALAAMRWNERFGDRHTSIAVLAYGAQPDRINDVLSDALLTDEELAQQDRWRTYPDPLGDWYANAGDILAVIDETPARYSNEGEQR